MYLARTFRTTAASKSWPIHRCTWSHLCLPFALPLRQAKTGPPPRRHFVRAHMAPPLRRPVGAAAAPPLFAHRHDADAVAFGRVEERIREPLRRRLLQPDKPGERIQPNGSVRSGGVVQKPLP